MDIWYFYCFLSILVNAFGRSLFLSLLYFISQRRIGAGVFRTLTKTGVYIDPGGVGISNIDSVELISTGSA